MGAIRGMPATTDSERMNAPIGRQRASTELLRGLVDEVVLQSSASKSPPLDTEALAVEPVEVVDRAAGYLAEFDAADVSGVPSLSGVPSFNPSASDALFGASFDMRTTALDAVDERPEQPVRSAASAESGRFADPSGSFPIIQGGADMLESLAAEYNRSFAADSPANGTQAGPNRRVGTPGRMSAAELTPDPNADSGSALFESGAEAAQAAFRLKLDPSPPAGAKKGAIPTFLPGTEQASGTEQRGGNPNRSFTPQGEPAGLVNRGAAGRPQGAAPIPNAPAVRGVAQSGARPPARTPSSRDKVASSAPDLKLGAPLGPTPAADQRPLAGRGHSNAPPMVAKLEEGPLGDKSFVASIPACLALPFLASGPAWIGFAGMVATVIFVVPVILVVTPRPIGAAVGVLAMVGFIAYCRGLFEAALRATMYGHTAIDPMPDIGGFFGDVLKPALPATALAMLLSAASMGWIASHQEAIVSNPAMNILMVVVMLVPFGYWPMALALSARDGHANDVFAVGRVVKAMLATLAPYTVVVLVGALSLFLAMTGGVIAIKAAGGATARVMLGVVCGGSLCYAHGVMGAMMGRLIRENVSAFGE